MFDFSNPYLWNKLITGSYWSIAFIYYASALLDRPFSPRKTILICLGASLYGWIWNSIGSLFTGIFYILGYYIFFFLLLVWIYRQSWRNAIYLALIEYFSVGFVPRLMNWLYTSVGGTLYIEEGIPHWQDPWIHLMTILSLFGILYFVRRQVKKIAGYRLKTKEFIYMMTMALPLAFFHNGLLYVSTIYIELPLGVLIVLSILSIGVMLDMVSGLKNQQDLEELKIIEQRLKDQYQLHLVKTQSSDLIMQKCHDLQKHLRLFQETSNQGYLDQYQAELKATIDAYETVYETGNATLDSILSEAAHKCRAESINLICLADGQLVDFIEPIDLCSIFGNALDNAIESARCLSDPHKKIIHLKIFQEKYILLIRVENYYEHDLNWQDGQLATTKTGSTGHGLGLKSIRYAAEKYQGNVRVSAEEGKFTLTILFTR